MFLEEQRAIEAGRDFRKSFHDMLVMLMRKSSKAVVDLTCPIPSHPSRFRSDQGAPDIKSRGPSVPMQVVNVRHLGRSECCTDIGYVHCRYEMATQVSTCPSENRQ